VYAAAVLSFDLFAASGEYAIIVVLWYMACVAPALLLAALLHREDLHEPDEDVDHVELEADRLLERVRWDHTRLSELGVVQDLLGAVKTKSARATPARPERHVLVENKAGEDGEAAVERDGLSHRESAHAKR
jgi:hypothetical protein